MSDFRISRRAFDALFIKFDQAIERYALSRGTRTEMIEDYKHGFFQAFIASELARINDDDQVKLFDLISDQIASLNNQSLTIDLQANKREVKIA
jgi:hypothetical protein